MNLNKSRNQDGRCPPTIKDELVIYVPFAQNVIQHAMDNWPDSHKRHRASGDTGAYFYKDHIYQSLGVAA